MYTTFMASATPLLQQYFSIKENYPHALVLFQVGDFYELFFEDATRAAGFLGIALTKRGVHQGKPVPLCGVPVHTLDHHVMKLVQGGYHVAVCDQLEPAQAGKVVQRGVTRVLTPGTLTDSTLLQDTKASYCAFVYRGRHGMALAFLEVLAGTIHVTLGARDDDVRCSAELRRFSPDEVLVASDGSTERYARHLRREGYVVSPAPELSDEETVRAWLDTCSINARDLVKYSQPAWYAFRLLVAYMAHNQKQALEACRTIICYTPDDYMILDAATQSHLEIVATKDESDGAATLAGVVDHAVTPMGSRCIKKWLARPHVVRAKIVERHEVVAAFMEAFEVRSELTQALKQCGDIERVVGRIALRRAHVADYKTVASCCAALPRIRECLAHFADHRRAQRIYEACAGFDTIADELQRAIADTTESDHTIRPGYSQELDELREKAEQSQTLLQQCVERERERTGIASLKLVHNKIHGYALEVTSPNAHLVPEEYRKVQTLVNRSRYAVDHIETCAREITYAEENYRACEERVYQQLCDWVFSHVPALRTMAYAVAECDALLGFARASHAYGYVVPKMHDGRDIVIEGGRHPVVERLEEHYIPNDAILDHNQRTWVITGPNMGGKSTFLRQVALTCILAQAGCCVPARRAELPLLDRVFTRIGASDNVARGKSTFLVEMEETAVICNQATDRSLVILDEVGRGTSTHDGMAIAQAVLEHLHTTRSARMLFATHYHELTELAEQEGIASYHAASKQTADGIILLYTIAPGVADSSFGLEVARRVNLPQAVVDRATRLLQQMISSASDDAVQGTSGNSGYVRAVQEKTVALERKIAVLEQEKRELEATLRRLHEVDCDDLSPKQAFDIVWRLKRGGG